MVALVIICKDIHLFSIKIKLIFLNYLSIFSYDHLSSIIKHAIDLKPPNVIDYFEEFSRNIREQRFCIQENSLDDVFEKPQGLKAAKKILTSIQTSFVIQEDTIQDVDPDEFDTEHKDEMYQDKIVPYEIFHQQFYWRLAGFGFHERETFYLSWALGKLSHNSDIANYQFWGKMYGIKQNYYIAEASLTEKCIKNRNKNNFKIRIDYQKSDVEDNIMNLFPRDRATNSLKDDQNLRPNVASLPINDYFCPLQLPPEKFGEGSNRYSYFVISNFNDDWFELPQVTPEQICVSKNVHTFLTGNLHEKVISYPPFPGHEQNYLRALVTRISASTHISPDGYYQKTVYESDEEDKQNDKDHCSPEDDDAPININYNYRPFKMQKLMDIKNWVHHKPYLLKQGRVQWCDPSKVIEAYKKQIKYDASKKEEYDPEDEMEDLNEEEIEENDVDAEGDDVDVEQSNRKPEEVIRLFTSCNSDKSTENVPVWSLRMTSSFNKRNATVLARSNIWPGAVAFTVGRVLNNLYIGWGNKYTKRNFSYLQLPSLSEEYPIGPEILEINDPPLEDEETWKLSHTYETHHLPKNEEKDDETIFEKLSVHG